MKYVLMVALFVAGALATPAVDVELTAAAAPSCESLASRTFPGTTITLAQVIDAGAFTPPASARGAAAPPAAAKVFRSLPPFCRVAATLKPSKDSDIKIEVWLPATGWNGKFQGVGNGGWAGSISYPALAAAVTAGYAAASTDTGHVGNTAAFALDHPEKLVDMGYRAVHEMTVQGRAITDAFYGSRPSRSVWNGCSQGGRQAITEAERYPADYDAILAGAPAIYNMELHVARVALNALVHRTADSPIPPEKFAMVHDAVLAACDARDGVKDGVIDSPTSCDFDPSALTCKGADSPSCLTAAQVETMRGLYGPIKNGRGEVVSPPLLQPGTELAWGTLAGPKPLGLATEAMQYVVFKDAAWDWHRFNPATDFDIALKADERVLGLTDPNLKPFFDRGGKLLMYHGWSDPQVSAQNSVRYFNDVVKTTGKGVVGKSISLYMVPGMGHCQGGPGTDTFDKVAAIERWVETGRAPEQIVASHVKDGVTDRTRPLCPYPQVAQYKGTGSTDEAANFVCKVR
jgi:Tannase and feruloyl esterase